MKRFREARLPRKPRAAPPKTKATRYVTGRKSNPASMVLKLKKKSALLRKAR
jgi:hypothetical protein